MISNSNSSSLEQPTLETAESNSGPPNPGPDPVPFHVQEESPKIPARPIQQRPLLPIPNPELRQAPNQLLKFPNPWPLPFMPGPARPRPPRHNSLFNGPPPPPLGPKKPRYRVKGNTPPRMSKRPPKPRPHLMAPKPDSFFGPALGPRPGPSPTHVPGSNPRPVRQNARPPPPQLVPGPVVNSKPPPIAGPSPKPNPSPVPKYKPIPTEDEGFSVAVPTMSPVSPTPSPVPRNDPKPGTIISSPSPKPKLSEDHSHTFTHSHPHEGFHNHPEIEAQFDEITAPQPTPVLKSNKKVPSPTPNPNLHLTPVPKRVERRPNVIPLSTPKPVVTLQPYLQEELPPVLSTTPKPIHAETPTPRIRVSTPSSHHHSPTPRHNSSPIPRQFTVTPSPTPKNPSPSPRHPSPTPRHPSPTPRHPSPTPRHPSPTPRHPSPTHRHPTQIPSHHSATPTPTPKYSPPTHRHPQRQPTPTPGYHDLNPANLKPEDPFKPATDPEFVNNLLVLARPKRKNPFDLFDPFRSKKETKVLTKYESSPNAEHLNFPPNHPRHHNGQPRPGRHIGGHSNTTPKIEYGFVPIKGEPNLFHKEYYSHENPNNPTIPLNNDIHDLPSFGPPYGDKNMVEDSINKLKVGDHKHKSDGPPVNNNIETFHSTLFRKTPKDKPKIAAHFDEYNKYNVPTTIYKEKVDNFGKYPPPPPKIPDFEPGIDEFAAPSPIFERDVQSLKFPMKVELPKHESEVFNLDEDNDYIDEALHNNIFIKDHPDDNLNLIRDNPTARPPAPPSPSTNYFHQSSSLLLNPKRPEDNLNLNQPQNNPKLNLIEVNPNPESVGYQQVIMHDSETSFDFPKEDPKPEVEENRVRSKPGGTISGSGDAKSPPTHYQYHQTFFGTGSGTGNDASLKPKKVVERNIPKHENPAFSFNRVPNKIATPSPGSRPFTPGVFAKVPEKTQRPTLRPFITRSRAPAVKPVTATPTPAPFEFPRVREGTPGPSKRPPFTPEGPSSGPFIRRPEATPTPSSFSFQTRPEAPPMPNTFSFKATPTTPEPQPFKRESFKTTSGSFSFQTRPEAPPTPNTFSFISRPEATPTTPKPQPFKRESFKSNQLKIVPPNGNSADSIGFQQFSMGDTDIHFEFHNNDGNGNEGESTGSTPNKERVKLPQVHTHKVIPRPPPSTHHNPLLHHTAATPSNSENEVFPSKRVKERHVGKVNPTKLTKPYISVKPREDHYHWKQHEENDPFAANAIEPIKINDPTSGNYFHPTLKKLHRDESHNTVLSLHHHTNDLAPQNDLKSEVFRETPEINNPLPPNDLHSHHHHQYEHHVHQSGGDLPTNREPPRQSPVNHSFQPTVIPESAISIPNPYDKPPFLDSTAPSTYLVNPSTAVSTLRPLVRHHGDPYSGKTSTNIFLSS